MDKKGRRQFLGLCLGGLATGAFAGVAYPVYRYLSPISDQGVAGKLVIHGSELAGDGAKFFQYAGSSAVLVRSVGGDLIALSAVCTHLGCIVQWHKESQEFICPCHAGRYSADGAVVSGPPPKPLPRLPISVVNDTITVG